MTEFETDQGTPEFKLSDLLTTMRANRADVVAMLADRHRQDGVADHSLMHSLMVCQCCITALEQERDRW